MPDHPLDPAPREGWRRLLAGRKLSAKFSTRHTSERYGLEHQTGGAAALDAARGKPLECRLISRGGGDLRVGIGFIERAGKSSRALEASDLRGVHLGLEIGLRDGDLLLRAANLEIIQRHFRSQRHFRRVDIFARGLDRGVIGLKLPARAAKKIEIPKA